MCINPYFVLYYVPMIPYSSLAVACGEVSLVCFTLSFGGYSLHPKNIAISNIQNSVQNTATLSTLLSQPIIIVSHLISSSTFSSQPIKTFSHLISSLVLIFWKKNQKCLYFSIGRGQAMAHGPYQTSLLFWISMPIIQCLTQSNFHPTIASLWLSVPIRGSIRIWEFREVENWHFKTHGLKNISKSLTSYFLFFMARQW